MQRIEFEEAVEMILAKDSRYCAEAYLFLRDALDYTLRETDDAGTKENRHVSGPELLEGFRKYSLNEFGPMVTTVLDEWGIQGCSDIGAMVFNLIEVGVFGKTAHDRKEDFIDVYDFDEAFRKPFLPKTPARSVAVARAGGGASGSLEPEKRA
jgi:uncharacterized repeat protein (TIGR04138 family)